MPLRDHFRPPVSQRHSWEELHGQWPGRIVQKLNELLPDNYIAGPRVHLGRIEIDIAAYESGLSPFPGGAGSDAGVATATWARTEPAIAVETESPDEYEVRIYDMTRDWRLVAVIELVSPANQDRPESRSAFVGKSAALLQKGIAVSIVDLVADIKFNLYTDLLRFLSKVDPTMPDEPPTYAASCGWVRVAGRYRFESWSHSLSVGQPLPILPLWLDVGKVIPLDLEASYENTCRDLRIV